MEYRAATTTFRLKFFFAEGLPAFNGNARAEGNKTNLIGHMLTHSIGSSKLVHEYEMWYPKIPRLSESTLFFQNNCVTKLSRRRPVWLQNTGIQWLTNRVHRDEAKQWIHPPTSMTKNDELTYHVSFRLFIHSQIIRFKRLRPLIPVVIEKGAGDLEPIGVGFIPLKLSDCRRAWGLDTFLPVKQQLRTFQTDASLQVSCAFTWKFAEMATEELCVTRERSECQTSLNLRSSNSEIADGSVPHSDLPSYRTFFATNEIQPSQSRLIVKQKSQQAQAGDLFDFPVAKWTKYYIKCHRWHFDINLRFIFVAR